MPVLHRKNNLFDRRDKFVRLISYHAVLIVAKLLLFLRRIDKCQQCSDVCTLTM